MDLELCNVATGYKFILCNMIQTFLPSITIASHACVIYNRIYYRHSWEPVKRGIRNNGIAEQRNK